MSYSVYYEPSASGRYLIYSAARADLGYSLIDPKISQQINKSGTFRFSIFDSHPYYDIIQPFDGLIKVYDGTDRIYCGRVLSCQRNFYRQKAVVCESELAFFNDVTLRPGTYLGTLADYFKSLLHTYNASATTARHFRFGSCDMPGNVEIDRKNYTTVWRELQSLITDHGGFFSTAVYSGSGRSEITEISYTVDPGPEDTQKITFGKNLINLTDFISAQNFYNVMIPTGATVSGSVVTIESVNGGLDYITPTGGVGVYGNVEKRVSFPDIDTPSALLTAAQTKLDEDAQAAQTLTISAMDLHLLDANVAAFRLGKQYRIVSPPHGFMPGTNNLYPLTKIELNLTRPDNSVYTFGTVKQTLTGGIYNA